MKKIGIVIQSLSDGGAEKVAANLSLIYESLGYDVYIILYENRVSFDYSGKIISLDIEKKHGYKKIFRDIEIYKKLKAVKKEYKLDIVISHLPKTDLLNCLTKQPNEKIITTIHNNIDFDYPTYMKKMLPYIIKKSDLIASVSKVGEFYLKNGYNAENVKTIYNPQMLDRIEILSNEQLDDNIKSMLSPNTIINIGRLNIQKGQWHLIRAFSEVVKVKNDAKLIIVGKGELEERLRKLAKNLNIQDNVIFTGFTDNPYKYVKYSKLYVGTSLYEGFGMTLVEAMSLGVPVISTDCVSGPREIIEPSKFNQEIDYNNVFTYGMLVPNFGDREKIDTLEVSDDEKFLANKIIEILDDEKMYSKLSEASKERSKIFSNINIAKVWEEELKLLSGDELHG